MNSEPCPTCYGKSETCPTCYGTRQIEDDVECETIINPNVVPCYSTRLLFGMQFLDGVETKLVDCDAKVTGVTTSGFEKVLREDAA